MLEWEVWFFVVLLLLFNLDVEAAPLLVVGAPLFLVLLDAVRLASLWRHLHGLLECVGVDLLQDCLKGNQTLLQNFVPVVVS